MIAWLRRYLLLIVLVVVPTCVAAIYYGAIASDIYVSESRFLVRSPQHEEQTGPLSQLLGAGGGGARDETYAVHDYILSRDALRQLEQRLPMRQAFSSKHADVFNKFPGFGSDDSFEEFYRYYSKHVGVEYDST